MNNLFKTKFNLFLPLSIVICIIIVMDVNAQEVGMTAVEGKGEIISDKMPPLDSSKGNIIKGKKLYNTNCSVCHGRNGNIENVDEIIMDKMDPKPSDLMNHLIYKDRTDWELFSVIRNGIKGTTMVPYKKLLSVEDTWLIVIYLKTLPPNILKENQHIEDWSSWNFIFNLSGYLIGLTGIILSYILYKKTTVGPRPTYQLKVVKLLGETVDQLPGDVTIYFKKSKITQLTKTFIVYWNSGNATILGQNIVDDDKLRFCFKKGSEILAANVAKRTKEANKFRISFRTEQSRYNELDFSFDYLDSGDGATIEILHTDTIPYPELLGSIRGIPKGSQFWGDVPIIYKPLWTRLLSIGFMFCLFSTITFLIFYTTRNMYYDEDPLFFTFSRFIVPAVLIIFLFLTSYRDLWLSKPKFPKQLIID